MKQNISKLIAFFAFIIVANFINAQETGDVRGFIYDKNNGEPIIFTNVFLQGTTLGASTDINGFYSINKIPVGEYTLVTTYIGYDTGKVDILIEPSKILKQDILIAERSELLGEITISAEKEEAFTEVKTSVIKVSPKQIKKIPSVGGEADLVQYLQVVPGVVFSGDQGGQLYIRGGSPIQTKVMLDGVTIYNPFHSIGFFSVFETELIKNVDVYTGGFAADYGGRISAVIDIATKDGNKKELQGSASVSPFMSKLVFEGPLKKFNEETGSSSSFLVTSKYSYLDKTSKSLYSYIDTAGLPFNFFDIFGKVSFNSKNGSKFNLFSFNFTDEVLFQRTSNFKWDSFGIGGSFVLVPPSSKALVNGYFSYSDYSLVLQEADKKPRTSDIGGFNLGINFTYYLKNAQEAKYGLEIGGFGTDFSFFNPLGFSTEASENTTELAFYYKHRINLNDKVILEPGIRFNVQPSISATFPEPRIGLKYNISKKMRFKASAGLFSQNLISTKDDRDVVNLFNGFFSSPDGTLIKPNGETAKNNLQTASHLIAGLEFDLPFKISANVEAYRKDFQQLIGLNRNKISVEDPDFALESGTSTGIDFLFKYDKKDWFAWVVYSLSYTDRFDGEQTYNPHYDRRHNVNFLASKTFGKNLDYEASFRWNLGSGFPFTKTQGFYEQLNIDDGISTDFISQNGILGIIYDDEINGGRLPFYHRLDVSLKKYFALNTETKLTVIASVTNVYDRENIFYFDRVRFERVNQLPLLPSLSASFEF